MGFRQDVICNKIGNTNFFWHHVKARDCLPDAVRQTSVSVQCADSVQTVTDADRHTGTDFDSSCNTCIFLSASLFFF